jgi:DNA-binding NarL/FixJ family response regulator
LTVSRVVGTLEPVPPLRLAIATEVRFYREGLAQTLGAHADLQVVASVVAPDELIGLAPPPDVALVDIHGRCAPAAVPALLAALPGTRVVALGIVDEEAELLALVEQGVSGFVMASGSVDDVAETVRSVARGETLASPRFVATLMRRVTTLAAARRAPEGDPHPALTPRERQILMLLDDGLSNKEIAQRLTIEVATVKNHVHRILEKLKVTRRGEAVAVWRRAAQQRG